MLPHFFYAIGMNIYIYNFYFLVVKYERRLSVIAYLIGIILGICGNQIGIEKMFFIIGIFIDLC
jgi:hypothetical protein